MSSTYGKTFARAHLERGDAEAALEAADQDLAQRPNSPEPHFDRACALEELEQFDASVEAYERSVVLNRTDKTLDRFMLDDAYFSALVNAATNGTQVDPAAWFSRYEVACPDGAHVAEAQEWRQRALGNLPSTLDKTKALG